MSSRASKSTNVATVSSASPPPVWRTLRTLLFGSTESLLHQFARYLVGGGLAFVIDFGSLYLLTEFAGIHYLLSAAVAFLFGLVTIYSLSRVWVFDRRTVQDSAMEFVVFAVIGVVGLGFNEGIIWFVREKIHLHYLVAICLSGCFSSPQ